MLPCLKYIKGFILCSLSQIFYTNMCIFCALVREIDEDFRSELDRPIPIESVNAVWGQRAQLPCDISTKDKDDGVSMVLWFRDADGEPLYSFDVRNKPFDSAKPWSSPTVFKDRAKFVAKTQPAFLVIDPIRTEDETVYRCRVDFQNSPTKNSKVNLTVIEPPQLPTIFDDKNRDRSKVAEPFNEGSEVTLHCEVTGGKPVPRIDWYLEEKLLYGETEYRSSSKVTIKRLTIPSLSRDYQSKKLSCHASNTNLVSPATRNIILNINLKPLFINITTKQDYLSAEKSFNIECRCYGSKPPAHITWWLGSRQITQVAKSSLTEGNMTDVSIISFRPLVEDDGRYLTCRAENPSIGNSAIEDKWRLNVQYNPILTLKIGSSLDANNIKEGDDVYFECYIRANPKIYKFAWFHNGLDIPHNISTNIIKTDHNLILQRIKKPATGNFTCYAANAEGAAESNPVILNVKYAPVCKKNGDEIYGAFKQETILLKCEVDANPPPIEFLWTFNNSGDMKAVHEPNFITTHGSPFLNHTPRSDSEFGTLSCRARNIVGMQETACFFQIVAAGHPHPLLNCSMNNLTLSRLRVECSENFDGGLPQYFLMEIWEPNGLVPSFNLTERRSPPIFQLDRIDPAIEYEIRLYSVNPKGRSEPVILRTSPTKGVAMYANPSMNLPFGSLTVVLFLLGICSIVLMCIASIVVCRRREKTNSHIKNPNHDDAIYHGAMLISSENGASIHNDRRSSDDDPDPDIIPNVRERKVLKTFAKFQKTPPLKRFKKSPSDIYEDDIEHSSDAKIYRNHSHLDKDSLQVNRLLPLGSRGNGIHTAETVIVKPAHNHKLGPEVVTASHRLQESCI
ncbi:protein turtle homolog B-like [Planococcus citri]|uniref:protein turtle homolog B-like n=1 Tax=Planococcus citri TaxID=170843 RepID=UPI0031F98975